MAMDVSRGTYPGTLASLPLDNPQTTRGRVQFPSHLYGGACSSGGAEGLEMRAHLGNPKVLSEDRQCGKCAGMFSWRSGQVAAAQPSSLS